MAPSGARLPFSPTTPPVALSGVSTGWITRPSAAPSIAARFSAMVRPVTVMQSPCSRPARSSSFNTTGTPPAS